MSEGFRNAIRGEAGRADRLTSLPRYAVVDGVDTTRHAVRVRYQPEDTLSGWLPVGTLSVGAGWGLHALPRVGAQVVVTPMEGSAESGVVTAVLFSDQQRPPETPVGAIHLFSENGARLKLNADGTADFHAVQLRFDSDTLAQLVDAVAAKITAPDVQIGAAGQTLQALLMAAAATIYNGHTHSTPSGQSGTPSATMTAAHMTSVLKAG